MWTDEGISLDIQAEFNIMYDPQTNYIAIPIFDSIGSFVGTKGRYFGEPDEYHPRFMYIEKCNKAKVLYGYWQNREFIKNSKHIIVVESEKSVLKLAEYGYRNVVSTGGKTISKYQVELITRTGCTPIFAFDKDVEEDELQDIANMFVDGISVYAVIDKDNLLDEKESPMDRQDAWERLYKDCVFKLK
jgi:DNA primase